MKQSFPYIPPAAESQLVYTDGELMEQAVEAYDSRQYLKSLQLLIDALDYNFRERYGNADGTSFKIPHGSIVVNINIKPDTLHISADFLKLPENGRVAMLREIAEMNNNKLILPRFVKTGDFLKMEYTCPITDTHPHKIHAIIRDICETGDKYDDELCSIYDAERCYTPKVTPYTPDEVNDVYAGLQTLGKLALEAAAEFCGQRRYGYAMTMLDGAIHQFIFFANPQGQLINDIQKTLDSFEDERPIEELVGRATNFINQLLSMSKEELVKDLYSVELMVSMKSHETLQDVQDAFEDLHQDLTVAMQKHDYEQVVVRMYYNLYRILTEFNIPLLLEYVMLKALQDSAALPVKEAAEILIEALDKIMAGDLTANQEDEEDDDEEDEDEEDLVENPGMNEEAIAAAHKNIVNVQQKMAEAMSGGEVAEIQRKMDEALKAGDRDEYLRLATELQVHILKLMGS